ncbi:hypothetical protein [Wolbachia endosymbiont (group B) of Melanostoma mellinum]|uniref:hypothetical protein n=1 Tax=Wolbachia endosymbiont (group B) of Melanostoma mellinum TaxID=2954030 RepID=UPI00222F1544|nr:hypothetical protein [Wolbachia endosymbiont (group B) of Melanostoma mellinum]
MDFDKAGNAEDLDNEKLQLICKAYNRELLSNQRVIDGINSMNYSKLKILCKYNNKFSYKGIEELLSDKEIVDNINDYDDEMLRSMINHATSEHNILEILKGGEVCNTNNEFESSDSEENEEDYGYYDNSDYEEDEKNDLNNFAKEALGNKGTNEKRVDDGQFHNINHVIFIYMLKSNKFTDKDFTKLYDNKEILERINSVTDERFELILSSNKFDGTSIIELLENQNAARNIDLIDKETLKYIIENDKFSLKDIIKLLENQEVVERINSIGPKKSKIILNSGKFDDINIIVELLKNKKVAKNINLLSEELFEQIVKNNEFSSEHIIKALEDREFIKLIKLIDPGKSKIILNSDKFNDTSVIVELLKNKGIAENINIISEELLKYIVKSDRFSSEYIIKVLKDREFIKLTNLIDSEKSKSVFRKFDYTIIIELLKNKGIAENINIISEELLKYIVKSDRFSSEYTIKVLKDREFIKLTNLIDSEKSKSVFRKFDYTIIIELLKNQEVVKRINSMNSEIFNLIFKYLDKGYIMDLLKYQSLFDQINSLDGNKVSIMISNNFCTDEEIVEILKDQSLLARVNSIDLEKLELISNSSKFYRPMIMDLLKSQNFIDSINTEKFRLLLNSIKLHGKRIITLLKDQNAVKHINAVNNEELKAITDNVTGKVFVNIFKNFKPSVKSTLRLAILLRKAGKITDINIDYLNNKERIYEDIIKYVSQELDINIESLIPLPTFKRYTECEEPVSKLYNLSLEQVIENINPHKRARYS